MKKVLINILSAIFITGIMPFNTYAANPASFILSSSSSAITGSTFNLSISENGDNVNVVTMKLSFDSTKLQLVSSFCSGSFPNKINETNGLTCYSNGGSSASGSTLAATVGFKALAGSGSAVISMVNDSMIAAGGADIWNHTPTSRSINLTTPESPTPPPPSSGGSITTPPPSTTTSTTSTVDNTQTTSTTSTPQTTDSTTQSNAAAGEPSTLGSTDTNTSLLPETENQTPNDSTSNTQLLNTLLPLIVVALVAGSLIGGLLYTKRKQSKPAKRAKKKASKKSASIHKKPTSKKRQSRK